MNNITLNSRIFDAYKVGLIDARICNSLLRSNRKLLKDCLDITKNNYDEIYNFGIKSFNTLQKALRVAENNTFDFKDIFFKALQNGFYFKDLRTKEIYHLQPNTFAIHYYLTDNGNLDCGFSFLIGKAMHFVYLFNKDDYKYRWALKKELLKDDN